MECGEFFVDWVSPEAWQKKESHGSGAVQGALGVQASWASMPTEKTGASGIRPCEMSAPIDGK